MPSPGAFLALWNDIEPARTAEYERWHTLEHVPERVWVPGFASGARYVTRAGEGARYFTLYQMDSLSALESPQYRSLVEAPTPWSASMRPSFRNFLRKTCSIAAEDGLGCGAGLLVARLVWATPGDAPAAPAWHRFAGELLHEGAQACAMRVQVGRVAPAGPQAIRNIDTAPPGEEFIAVVHTAWPEDMDSLRAIFAAVVARVLPPPWMHQSLCRLASIVRHAQVGQPQRPAPRHELMPMS